MSFLEKLRSLIEQRKREVTKAEREEREKTFEVEKQTENEQERRRVKQKELREIYLNLVEPIVKLVKRELLDDLGIESELATSIPTEEENKLWFSSTLRGGERKNPDPHTEEEGNR